MKKRVNSLLLGVAAIVGFGAFATACIDSTSEHTHTYAETWEKDAEGHWNALTCECTDVTPEKKAHVDKNNDSLCDICEYDYEHTHTYAEDWTVDCTNHWHAADCDHLVAGADLAAHVDENEDGECDVCGYVIEDIHEHYYASEWSTDEEYHWHAAVCEHKDQVADKAAHELNVAGDCIVCGAHVKDVNMADVGAVLAAAQANNYKVAFGDVIATEAVYGGTGAQTLENGKTNKVHFALGNGQSYIQYVSFDKDGNYIGQDEQWYEELPNGEVFGVQMEAGEYELEPISGAAQFLNGYNYIPGSIIPSDSADTSTLANMLVALYEQMKAGIRVSNAVEGIDEETGYYEFSYTYYSVNAQTEHGAVYNVEIELYNVAVTFSVNEDMIIDEANFCVEVYRDYSNIQNIGGQDVETGDPDLDYTWNDLGNGEVEIVDLKLKDTANPTFYTYSVAQASGERTFTTPYPRAALIPTSFEFLVVLATEWNEDYTEQIVTDSEKVGDYLEVDEGEYLKFAIGDILPKTASSKFLKTEDFTYSFVNNDANSTAIAWDSSDTLLNGYNAFSKLLKLKLLDAGEYTVTIGFGGLTKTFTLKIVGEPEPEIPEDDANHINVATTDTYGWADEYSYTATVEGTYTFTVPAGLGVWEKSAYDNFSGDPKVDYNTTPNGGTFDVDLEAGQTFEFYVGAMTEDTWVITVSWVEGEVDGGDVGGGDDVGGGEESGTVVLANIVGTYTCGAGELVINADGTMTLDTGSRVQNYTIAIDGNTITYTLNGNTPYTADNNMAAYFGYLTFDENGMPATFVYNGEYPLTAGGGSEGGEGGDEPDAPVAMVLGSNTLVFTDAEVTANVATRTLTVETNGNFKLASSNLWVKSITDANGNEITRNDDYSYTLTAGSYTVEFGNLSMFGVAAGVNCTVNVTNETPEEVDPSEPAGSLSDGENTISVTEANIEAGTILYSYYAYESGNYQFSSNWLGVTVKDEDGNVISQNEDYSVTLEGWTAYLVEIDVSFVFSAGDYTLTVEYLPPLGHQENPISIEVGDYTAMYVGNSYAPIWHKYVATANGTVTVSSTYAEADLMITAIFGNEVQSENATVSLQVMEGYTYYIAVADFEATENVEIPFTVAFVEGEVVADGTINVPYAIAVGENTAVIPQYGNVWFVYKALAAGSLTLTTESTNAEWSIQQPIYVAAEDNVIYVDMVEGDIIYLSVATLNWEADNIVFNAVWKGEPEMATAEIAQGDNTLAIAENTYLYADVYGLVGDYVLSWTATGITVEVDGVAVENGGTFNSMNPRWPVAFRIYAENYAAVAEFTLTVTAYVAPATVVELGENTVSVTNTSNGTSVEFTAPASGTYYVTPGANAVVVYDYTNYLAGETFSVELAEGAVLALVVLTEDFSASDVVVAISDTEPVAEEISYETVIVEGENTLYFSADEVSANAAARNATIENNGVYAFNAGNLFISSIVDADGNTIAKNSDYTYTLTAGNYTVNFGMLSMFGVSADMACELNVVLKGTLGSSAYPFVIDALPFEVTFESTHDVFYTYTADANYTITIACPEGCFISETGATKDSNGNYVFDVTAGQVVTFNPWSNGGTAPYTYTITAVEKVEEPTPDAGSVVTYMSAKHASGRYLKVEIDATNGTMTLTRSNMSGGWDASTSTSVYSYSYDGSTVTAEFVSGTACTLKWNADGTPASITWGSAAFTGFTVQ